MPSAATLLSSYYSVGGYSIPTTTPSTSATLLPSAQPTGTSSSSSSLSSGAKAGIGIGVAGGVISILVLLFLLFRHVQRKRREHKPATYESPLKPADPTAAAEAQGFGQEKKHGEWVGEMPAVQSPITHEMPIQQERLEISAESPQKRSVHELGVEV